MSSAAPTEYWKVVAGGVRAELARARRNATDLVNLLHLSRNSVYRRLNGEIPFDLSEIVLVAEYLGVTVESFSLQPERVIAA
jgi:hypothetical protein